MKVTDPHADDSEPDALLHGVLLLAADHFVLFTALLTDLLSDLEVQDGRLLKRMCAVL